MEDPKEWAAHRDRVVRDLAPVGYLETVIAERLAGLLWRLGRVARYETLSIVTRQESVTEDYMTAHRFDLGAAPDDVEAAKGAAQEDLALFAKLSGMKARETVAAAAAWGILQAALKATGADLGEEGPENTLRSLCPEAPAETPLDTWDGWSAGLLRSVLERLASRAGMALEEVLERTRLSLHGEAAEAQRTADAVQRGLERTRRERLLPDEGTMDRITKYEGHIERAFYRALHELQRLQAVRSGMPVPMAGALDVSVH
jgi:hypothetical protein